MCCTEQDRLLSMSCRVQGLACPLAAAGQELGGQVQGQERRHLVVGGFRRPRAAAAVLTFKAV
jgi:hypothetical protein